MIVYVDVLVCTNLYINLLLLRCTEWAAHITFSRLRRWLTALCGAAASLLMLLPALPWPLLLTIRLGLAFAMMALASGERRMWPLIRLSLLFFGANLLLAGAVLLCWNLWLPEFFRVRNGTVYCDISVWTLLGSTTVAYGVLWLLQRLRPTPTEPKRTRFRILLDGRETACAAMPDSGNTLREVFSDRPVSVVRLGALQPVLPPALLCDLQILLQNRVPPADWQPNVRIRVIPGLTVGGESLLPAIAPDAAFVWANDRWQPCPSCWLAVCADCRLPDTDCLLHCEMLHPPGVMAAPGIVHSKE